MNNPATIAVKIIARIARSLSDSVGVWAPSEPWRQGLYCSMLLASFVGCQGNMPTMPNSGGRWPTTNYKPPLPAVPQTAETKDSEKGGGEKLASDFIVRGQSPAGNVWTIPNPSQTAGNRYVQTPNPGTAAQQGPSATLATTQSVPNQYGPTVVPTQYGNTTLDQQSYGQPQYGQPQYGQPQYGQPQYGQPQAAPSQYTQTPYGQTAGQQPYTQPGFTQPAPAAQPQYGQQQYGQPQYGQPQYGQPQYGQPQYGQPQYPQAQPQYGQPQAGQLPPPVGSGYAQPQAPSAPGVGYGTANTYAAPGSLNSAMVAPGATGYVGSQSGFNSAIAPGAVPPPGVDPTTGLSVNSPYQPVLREAPIDVYVQEGRTGRIVLGGSVNSDLGVGGQVIIDERNFDFRRLPTSWGDLFGGRAFRGAGQNFRAELMPGNRVQRYTVNFTEPHLFGYSPISFSVGGFLYTRQFRDWTEQRLGGRVALGYDITRDLSITTELNMQDVKISSPRVAGVPELDRVLGSNDLYTGRVRLAHDTRDSPFMATEGHYLELLYDQVFGEFDYPRGQVNYSRYFLVRERADGGGRHTLASTFRTGISGADTPIFENFFAGGYSTLRGFSFRGASPKTGDVQVGGRLQLLGSLEYLFPLTADDMLRGIMFVDYGAISKDLNVGWDDYRIAPGFGLRVNVPALGPAPLAFDFAFPVKYVDTDDRQIFSFFMGFTR